MTVTEGNSCNTLPAGVPIATVDYLPTRQIATDLGVSVSTVLRIAQRLDITPAFEVPIYRGAKMWSPDQVAAIRRAATNGGE